VIKPRIYLTADSRLLFRQHAGRRPLLESIRAAAPRGSVKAAYLGACNGDRPEFFAIFEAAMRLAGVAERRHVTAGFGADERGFLAEADIVVLSGGDAARGWSVFEATGIAGAVRQRYRDGAVLVGVSAGAVQLGAGFADAARGFVPAFGFVPRVIDVHDEESGWRRLEHSVRAAGSDAVGVGIPWGGGVVVGAAADLHAVGEPAVALSRHGDHLVQTTLPVPDP